MDAVIEDKINLFERNESSHFKDVALHRIGRGGKKGEYEITRLNFRSNAIVQVQPQVKFFQNFADNKIDSSFVIAIDSLDVSHLRNQENETYLRFKYAGEVVILMSRVIPRHMLRTRMQATRFNENWQLVTFIDAK